MLSRLRVFRQQVVKTSSLSAASGNCLQYEKNHCMLKPCIVNLEHECKHDIKNEIAIYDILNCQLPRQANLAFCNYYYIYSRIT
jgi:hypothetical protein